MASVDQARRRVARANRTQRIIEATVIGAVLASMVLTNLSFQRSNRRTVKDAAHQTSGQLRALNDRLAEANGRIGQLEEALKAAGVPVPETPPSPARMPAPGQVPGVSTTAPRAAPAPPGTSPSTSTTQPAPPPSSPPTTQPTPPSTLPGGAPCPLKILAPLC